MTSLERKVSNMLYDFKKEHGNLPKYVSCRIRWNDAKTYYGSAVFALYSYDCDNEVKDDDIFFYFDKPEYLYLLLANIDFTMNDFAEIDEFYNEVDKYDTDDEENDDWSILHRGEDFCIVDIKEAFNEF